MRSDRPLLRTIRGPILLITLGVLFALQNFADISFGKTWPVLLIVFGLLCLGRRPARPVPPAQGYNWPPRDYRPPYAPNPYAQPAPAEPPAHEGGPAPASGTSQPTGDQTVPPAGTPIPPAGTPDAGGDQ